MARKVLLLHCPGDKIYLQNYYCNYTSMANYYWQPTDLVVLSGLLRDQDLRVIDSVADKLSFQEAESRILEFGPDVVIFSTGTATWGKNVAFLSEIKKKVPFRLVASSSMFIFEPGYFLKAAPAVDALIIDLLSPEVAEYIAGISKDYTALAVRTSQGLHIPPAKRPDKEFRIPVPRHELFNLKANRSPLARRTPFALTVTSFGCPFSCRFCVAGSMSYRFRTLDSTLEEFDHLRSLGVREIMFNDPTFTVSEKRVIELCRKMKERGYAFSWIANGHVKTLHEEMLSWMKAAGCHTLMIGVESGRDETLDMLSKGTNRKEIIDGFALCRKLGIKTLAYFIIGLPGETKDAIEETIRFAKELKPDFASFTVLTPDYGSALRQEAIDKGWVDPELRLFDQSNFPVFTAGNLSRDDIWKLREKAMRSFYLRPSYLIKKVLGIRSLRDMVLLLDQARAMFVK